MEHYDVDQLVVTVTPTIMDGNVVRWHRGPGEGRVIISASRNGVMGHGDYIAPGLFDRAWTATLAIANGQDVNHLATHRRRGITGPLVPIEPLQPQSGNPA